MNRPFTVPSLASVVENWIFHSFLLHNFVIICTTHNSTQQNDLHVDLDYCDKWFLLRQRYSLANLLFIWAKKSAHKAWIIPFWVVLYVKWHIGSYSYMVSFIFVLLLMLLLVLVCQACSSTSFISSQCHQNNKIVICVWARARFSYCKFITRSTWLLIQLKCAYII